MHKYPQGHAETHGQIGRFGHGRLRTFVYLRIIRWLTIQPVLPFPSFSRFRHVCRPNRSPEIRYRSRSNDDPGYAFPPFRRGSAVSSAAFPSGLQSQGQRTDISFRGVRPRK